ncbi:hypothetical protein ACHAC9_18990, partial [Massilia sp. CMS3.1]|uniref:hypothetical protein n=1 Tax=Massilia sp. CMS3.1 TaxID=3373083 RepID=UPI003EE634BB
GAVLRKLPRSAKSGQWPFSAQSIGIKNVSEISFHEATIRDIHTLDRAITIVVDEAIVESVKSSLRIELRDVTSIERDGVLIDSLKVEKKDGEILSLFTTSTGIELVVEWHDFSPLVFETRAYKVQCREFAAMPCP